MDCCVASGGGGTCAGIDTCCCNPVEATGDGCMASVQVLIPAAVILLRPLGMAAWPRCRY